MNTTKLSSIAFFIAKHTVKAGFATVDAANRARADFVAGFKAGYTGGISAAKAARAK